MLGAAQIFALFHVGVLLFSSNLVRFDLLWVSVSHSRTYLDACLRASVIKVCGPSPVLSISLEE